MIHARCECLGRPEPKLWEALAGEEAKVAGCAGGLRFLIGSIAAGQALTVSVNGSVDRYLVTLRSRTVLTGGNLGHGVSSGTYTAGSVVRGCQGGENILR